MNKKWWHDKVAYQIYPKSFCDTNGDGIGDLEGVIQKLDYLKELGIDIIWLCPIYQSPFIDQGYDISDYYKIAPEFGTMEDFDKLLEETKKRDMYIIMDLVINHCSSKHEWFQKALKDPKGKYGDYFYFREGKNGGPPSNYRSYFGGSAWESVKGTDLYYLHCFAKEQPDLNWENPEVKKELFDMVNWWLEKGVAGFRIDAIMNIKKDLEFPDYEPDSEDGTVHASKIIEKAEGIGELLEELKSNTFGKYDAFTVGEVFYMNHDELEEFVGENGHFSTMFDFSPYIASIAGKDWRDMSELDFKQWRDTIFTAQRECEGIGFLANILENHDEPRGNSHYLPPHLRNDMGIKMLSTINILLRGIPFIYQGQEIGMQNCRRESIDDYDDIETKNNYEVALKSGCTKEEALELCYRKSRDNARTPMQWDESDHGGFTTGTPWLKVNPDYRKINVCSQEKNRDSVLHYYRRLIRVRKDDRYREIFTYGKFVPAYTEKEGVFAYYRVLQDSENSGKKQILIAANFGKEKVTLDIAPNMCEIILSNTNKKVITKNKITIIPGEVLVLG